jgi:hypothetical protein
MKAFFDQVDIFLERSLSDTAVMITIVVIIVLLVLDQIVKNRKEKK